MAHVTMARFLPGGGGWIEFSGIRMGRASLPSLAPSALSQLDLTLTRRAASILALQKSTIRTAIQHGTRQAHAPSTLKPSELFDLNLQTISTMDVVQAVSGYISKMVSAGDGTSGTPSAKMKVLLLDSDTVSIVSTAITQSALFEP
ncbi:vacuolar protein sorting-associated protein 45 (Sec1 family protein) [Botrytis cinerea]